MKPHPDVCALLLAGGQSRRMGGGDKCLLPLAGRPLLERIVGIVRPQAAAMVLNANGDPARFAAFALPVAPDAVEGFPGPLAGVLTGLEWARDNAPECRWVASVPCDAPFIPADLVARLLDAAAAADADLACASSGGRDHPVVGLWPVRLAAELRHALVEEDIRKVDVWTARYRLARAEFGAEPVDPFFNVNRPEDLAAAEAVLARAQAG
jgi:molybdopterin-guanine dinucleotide biosynthesis protein A